MIYIDTLIHTHTILCELTSEHAERRKGPCKRLSSSNLYLISIMSHLYFVIDFAQDSRSYFPFPPSSLDFPSGSTCVILGKAFVADASKVGKSAKVPGIQHHHQGLILCLKRANTRRKMSGRTLKEKLHCMLKPAWIAVLLSGFWPDTEIFGKKMRNSEEFKHVT